MCLCCLFFNDTATTEIYTSDTLCPYTTLFRSSGSESLPMRTCGLPRCPVQPQSRPIAISRERCALAIGAEEVSAVDLVRDVGQFVGDAVGADDIGLALERGEIAHDARGEQPILDRKSVGEGKGGVGRVDIGG